MIGRTWFPFFKGGNEHQNFEIALTHVNEFIAKHSLRVINVESVHAEFPVTGRLDPIGLHVWWQQDPETFTPPTQGEANEQISESPSQLSCAWTYQKADFMWNTACGTAWAFTDEGPKENGMRFCHSCGKPLTVISTEAESEE